MHAVSRPPPSLSLSASVTKHRVTLPRSVFEELNSAGVEMPMNFGAFL